MPSANLAYGLVRRIVTVSIALIIIIASLATGLTAGVSTAQQEDVTVASSEVTCYEEDGTLWEDYSYTLSEPHWIHQQFVVIDARTGEEIDTAQTLVGDVAGEEIDGVDAREDLGQYAQEYNDGEPVVLDIVVTDAESDEQIDRLEAPQECYDMAIDRFGDEQPSVDDEDIEEIPSGTEIDEGEREDIIEEDGPQITDPEDLSDVDPENVERVPERNPFHDMSEGKQFNYCLYTIGATVGSNVPVPVPPQWLEDSDNDRVPDVCDFDSDIHPGS